MFYAVLALAAREEQSGSKHSGMIAFFDRHLIKTGIIDRDYSKILHLAFDRRQANDYGEQFLISQAEAEQSVADADEFVQKMKDYLKSP